ncbi:ACP S-malonyltransferase [Candidatus Omnitrophota bacterium]
MGGNVTEMVKTGFLFPGQGAQFVGMGKEVNDTYASSRLIYESANKILGYDIASLCFNGPEEDLMQTKFSQPAIFTTSIAVLNALHEKGIAEADACLGLSLGEYTALVAAGAMSFEDGLSLVKIRAEAMDEAARTTGGTMASIMGSNFDICKEVCDQIDGVWLANLNSPEQIVISGTVEAVQMAMQQLQDKGAKRAIQLKVSGAFHSELMTPARNKLVEAVEKVTITEPSTLFIPNFTAQPEKKPSEIKKFLLEQLTGTVKWSDSFAYAVNQGIQSFLEIGPGTVLKGLARKIDRTATVVSIHTTADIDGLMKEV